MENIAISVIVPVYGVEKFIERCARSIFGQTMTDGVEFIFVNDCATDRSLEVLTAIIDEYPPLSSQIKIINHLCNRGLAAARKTGLEAARGEYILNLDSDDYFERDMLEVMYKAAKDTNADVVVSDYFMTTKKGDRYQECPLYDTWEAILRSIITPWRYGNKTIGPSVWNKLIRRNLYTDHSIIPIEGINYGEDFIISMQILYYADVITKVDRAFVHYNKLNSDSYTQDKSASNCRQRLKATETVAGFLARKGCVFDEEFDERRFCEKMIAVTNCDSADLGEFLPMYPWLDYEKHKQLIARHWRLPYKFALQGDRTMFVFLRNLLLSIRRIYRFIYAR